jgi:glycosyltransferase involved in cell wall biosynthesis
VEGSRPKTLEHVPSGGFWLNVGTIEPRKNQRRLIEAYARYLAAGGTPMPLVLAGGKGWLMEDFQSHLAKLGISQQVIMTGYVTDDELIWLYRNCYANLYPSLFEGFGLPVLEGMQFGAPTMTSTSTSIPEVAGEAAILTSPEDTDAMTHAMLQLAAEPGKRDALHTAALAQAARFDWQHSAAALLNLYEEALASPKRHTTT